MYMCHAGEVVALQTVDKLPAEIRHTAYMSTWEGKLLVIGCRSFGEAHVAYMLDLKSRRWRKLKNLKKNIKEFEDKIWRNTSIHSVIPYFTMNESINK